jgi:hypothetical protein
MNLQLHQQQIASGLSASSSTARAFFAVLSAERLRGCCWAYQASSGIDLAPFFQGIDSSFEMLFNKCPADRNMEGIIRKLEEIVPKGGEPLFVQAQSGVICLLTALDILADGARTSISDVVRATIDALDNYEFSVRRRIKNDMQSPGDFPLLLRELEREIADVKFLGNYEVRGRPSLIERRLENLQFAIPPAV